MRLAVVSQSARIYAHFAHLAGHQVFAIDGFADADTLAVCTDYWHWPAILTGWNQADFNALIDKLDSWQADTLLIGSGFEQDEQAYTQLMTRYSIAGNTPLMVSKVKNPFWLMQRCVQNGIAMAEVSATWHSALSGQDWLIKQRGGCGGMHIHPWHAGANLDAKQYLQACLPGCSIGALCVGDGTAVRLIGLHQLHLHAGGYLYAGASRVLDGDMLLAMQCLVTKGYADIPLKGVFSVDTLWHDGAFTVLEMNPRLSASMRLYSGLPLIEAHLAGCQGQALPEFEVGDYHASHRILYAKQSVDAKTLSLPDWVEDRPAQGMIAAGQPVCSLYAQGNSEHDVQQQLLHQQTLLKKQWGSYVSERIQFIH